MEQEYIQIPQGILAETDKHQIPETYVQEYASYLQALVCSAVFTDKLFYDYGQNEYLFWFNTLLPRSPIFHGYAALASL